MNKTKKNQFARPDMSGKWLLFIYILAVAVAVFTVIHLILPAIALAKKEKVLDCTYQVHTHDDSCYTEIIQEDGTKEKILTCGKADYAVHVHTDDCYKDGILVCNLPEIKGHQHTAACWQTEQILVCGLEEDGDHTHDDSCYEEQKTLICGKQEMPHIHRGSCYDEDKELICGMLQVEEHIHGKECIKEVESTRDIESIRETEVSTDENAAENETSEIFQDGENDEEAVELDDAHQDKEDTENVKGIENTEKSDDLKQTEETQDDTEAGDTNIEEDNKAVQTFKAKAGRIEVVVKADQSAFPAGTTMKVKSVKNKKTVNALSDAVPGEVEGVEAVDITFFDEDGTEIEPEIPVQVTLTSSLIMDNAEPVVVHMDEEGKAEIIKKEKIVDAADGSKADEKNQVVFEAESFSVYALVYTVDFHYGEYEFNLEGNGEILLSELFEKLEIGEATENVTDVTFSDSRLLDIQKLAGDWRLISLLPFHTQEELEITFADGKILVITVTDAQYITDLSQIITGIIIRKNGEEMDPEQPIIVRDNDSFSVELEFTEHDEYQFAIDDTPMYYKMPDGFIIPDGFETTTDVEITVGGKRHILKNNKVTYDSNNHTMQLQWNTTDPEFAYLKMSSDAQVSFSVTGQFEKDVRKDVEFENSITVHISPPADAGVEKRGEYNMETKRIKYWISVKAEGNVYSDIDISDMLEGTALTYVDTGDAPFVFAWGENKQHTAGDLSAIKSSFKVAEDGKSFCFTIPGSNEVPALYDGEVLTLTYEAAVDIEKLELSSTSAYDEEGNIIQEVYDGTGNRVTLSNPGNMYDEPSNNETIWVEPIQFSDMNKESELSDAKNGVDAQGNDIRYRDITWTITTNSTAEASLAGSKITDTLTYSPDYVTMVLQPLTGDEAGIYVQKYDMVEDPADPTKTIEQQVGEGEYIPWTALHIKRTSGKDADGDPLNYINWTYDVPETDGSYKYVITYITRANLKDVTVPSTVFNDVNGKGGHDDAEETLWPEGDGDNISANKTVAGTSLENIEWDIDILARIKEYTDYFRVTDTLPSQWVDRINSTGSELRKDSVDISTEEKLEEYLQITGLQEGEKWTAEVVKGSSGNADKLLIRFYRNVGTDTEPIWEEGLKSYPKGGPEYTTVNVKNGKGEYVTRERRKIHIHLKTDNDQTWIDRATAFMSTKSWIAYHTNKVQVRGDVGDYDFSSATTPVVKPSIIKTLGNDASWLNQYMKVKVRESDGRILEYPAYRFLVNAGGIRSDNDTVHYTEAGIPYIEVNDVLDRNPDIWKLYKSTDFDTPNNNTSWMDLQVYHAERSGYANESEGAARIPAAAKMPESFTDEQKATGVYVLEERDGEINFKIYYPPKKADGSYYNFYTFIYWLVPKDEAAINTLIQETLKDEHKVEQAHVTKGVVNCTNKAQLILAKGNPLEDQADYKYEYNPTSKTVSYDDANKVAHYTVVLNEQKAKLLSENDTGNEIEMQDEHSANLSVDYSTITITTDPEDKKNQVSYDYSGNVGTFKIPDETKVTISYDARLIATPGTTVNFNNTVEMKGFKTEVTQTQKMSSTSASSAGVYQLELYKYGNGHMESGLAGATFRILDAHKRPITDRNGDEITFTTQETGYATITLDESIQGVALKKNTVYYLQELEAPVTYEEDSDPLFYKQDPVYYSFLISDNPDYSAPNGVYVYSNGDILKVRNYEDRGGINISKQFAGNYELSEEEKQKITFTLQKKAGSNWINVKTLKYSDMRYVEWKEEDDDNITGTYHYSIDNLSIGTYRIVESNMDIADNDVTQVTEYLVDGSSSEMIRQFSVTEEDLNDKSPKSHNIVVTNNYYKKVYTFTKQDADSGANLKGAVFSVFKFGEDNKTSDPVMTYTTGEDGRFEISEKDMLEGTGIPAYESGLLYYAVETRAPAGYEMPEEPEKYYFYFGGSVPKQDGVIAVDLSKDFGAATVTNEKAKVSVPVKKVWGPGNAQLDWNPLVKYIKVGLYQKEEGSAAKPRPVLIDEEALETILTAEKSTDTTTFTDLPAVSDSGKIIQYSVQETAVSYDGESEGDPEDSFNVSYSDITEGDGEEQIIYKGIRNTDKGAEVTVTKQWYGKQNGKSEVLLHNPQGDDYKCHFKLYRTTKNISSQSIYVTTANNANTKRYQLVGDTQFTPGELVTVDVDLNGASFKLNVSYTTQTNTTWQELKTWDWINEGSMDHWTTSFIVPEDASNLYISNYSDYCEIHSGSTLPEVRLTRTRSGSTACTTIGKEQDTNLVSDMEYVTEFTLPDENGNWSFSRDQLDKYDDEYKEYTYWVKEENDNARTTYRYKNGEVIVSNYEETTLMKVTKEWSGTQAPSTGILFDLYRTTDNIGGTIQTREDETVVSLVNYSSGIISEKSGPTSFRAKPGDRISIYLETPYNEQKSKYTFNGDLRKVIDGKPIIKYNDGYDRYVTNFWQSNALTYCKKDYTIEWVDLSDTTIEKDRGAGHGNLLQSVIWWVCSFGDNFSYTIINNDAPGRKVLPDQLTGLVQSSNTELVESDIKLDGSNTWQYENNGLMKYDKDGHEYHYFVVEHPVPGYKTEYDVKDNAVVIKNTKDESEDKGTLRITKNVMDPVPAKANNKSYYFTLSKDGYYYKNDGTATASPSYSTTLTDEFIHEIKPQNGTYPSVIFEGLPAGSYTVTEILKGEKGAEIPNYKLTSQIKVGNQEKANGVVEVIKDAAAEVVIENTYVYGVEMTDITAEKKWRNTEGEEIAHLPEDASVTLTLKRYMYDDQGKLIPDDIAWIESDHLAVLDGDMDDGEYEAWKYTWKDLEKVYWNGTEYVDYVYVVEESSVTYNGKTSDDPSADAENWQVACEHDGYAWTVTNTPNIQKVTLKKEWMDADNHIRAWPKDDESWIPVTVLLKKSMNISGVGTRESKDTVEFRLVPDNRQLAQLNSATGYTITYDQSGGYFSIDGLRDTDPVKIGSNTYIGKWNYIFEESKVESYTATVGEVSNGGKLVNTQEPVKKQLGVTKKLTLIDGTTDYTHNWPEEGFTFTLSQQTEQDGVVMPTNREVTVHKDPSMVSASELFDEITFKKPGTFDFIIKENEGSAENTAYDTASHSAKVTVEDIDGKLTVTDVIYDDDQSRLTVVNRHIVNGAVNFKVKKTFEGGTFADKQFSFRLSQVTDVGSTDLESDASKMKLTAPVTVTTPAEDVSEKAMTFDTDITFRNSGTYYFMIEEIVPEAPDTPDASGVYTKYDTHKQWITVNVDGESNVTKSYTSQKDAALPEDVDAAFVNEQILDFSATKKWLDSDGRTEIIPDADTQITLALTQWKDAEQVQTFTAPAVEQKGWSFTWKGLKKGYIDEYGISQDYQYQVTETQVSYDGKNFEVENDIAGKYIVTVDGTTITNRLNTKSVEFGKQWMDKDGNPMQWESKTQKDDNDQPRIIYWPEGVKIEVTVKREGDETYSQKFALTPDSTETGDPNHNVTWSLPEDGDTNKIFWFSIDGLEQYQSDGITEWRYYVAEDAAKVDGTTYLTEYSRETDGAYEAVKHGAKQYIINRYPETDVKVTKEWRDTKDKEVKIWPEGKTLTLTLYRKAKDVEPEKLAEFKEVSPGKSETKEITDNGYKLKCSMGYPFTFEVDGLPAADDKEQKYEYYFKEDQVPGYIEPIYGNSGTYLGKTDAAYHNGKITNIMPAASFEFHKLWRNEADKDIAWPKDAVINIALYSGQNTLVDYVQLTPEGGRMGGYVWTAEPDDYSTAFTFRIDDLPELDDEGEKLTYYVKELSAGDGYGASYYYMQTSNVQVDEGNLAAGTTAEHKLSGINTGYAKDGQYIVNRPQNGYELPSTGGPGTKTIYLPGILLTLSAGALLLMKRKKPA